MTKRPFIEVSDLCVTAGKDHKPIVNNVSFTAEKGEVIALIGESGRSATARASLRAMERRASAQGLSIHGEGCNIRGEPAFAERLAA